MARKRKKPQKTVSKVKTPPAPNFHDFHKCQFCPYRTKTRPNIVRHLRHHKSRGPKDTICHDLAPEPHCCPRCGFETHLTRVLQDHTSSIHTMRRSEAETADYVAKSFRCRRCQLQTYSLLVITRHVAAGCEGSEDPAVPSEKTEHFRQCVGQSEAALKSHVICERGRFKCVACEARFRVKWHLKEHVSVMHSGLKWLQCDQCFYRTLERQCLENHVLFKHSVFLECNVFRCEDCNFWGDSRQVLDEHVREVHDVFIEVD